MKLAIVFLLTIFLQTSLAFNITFTSICGSIHEQCQLTNTTALSSKICRQLPEFKSIKTLQVKDVTSESFPDYLSECFESLQTLNAIGIGLKYLVKNDFGNMTNLEVLNLDKNSLTRIDDVFENNAKLQRLILSNNRISVIDPKTFTPLVNLAYVDLSNNSLTKIDEQLFASNLKLETIFLNGNDFTRIDWKIFKPLKSLIYLKIFNTVWTQDGSQESYSLNNFMEVFMSKTKDLNKQKPELDIRTIINSTEGSKTIQEISETSSMSHMLAWILFIIALCECVLIIFLCVWKKKKAKSYKLDFVHETSVNEGDINLEMVQVQENDIQDMKVE